MAAHRVFRTVPVEIEGSARIDGANKMQTFVQVVLPLVAPGVVATAIYTFINTWNEFLYALILMNNTSKMTVAVALRSLDGAEILDWGRYDGCIGAGGSPVRYFLLPDSE